MILSVELGLRQRWSRYLGYDKPIIGEIVIVMLIRLNA